jgi:hypothetical protein
MVVRVVTKDVESAKLLLVDLVGLMGGECVSLQEDGEVALQLRGKGNGALVLTLEAVERWLEQTGTAVAEVRIDERSYTVEQTSGLHPRISSADSWSMGGLSEVTRDELGVARPR